MSTARTARGRRVPGERSGRVAVVTTHRPQRMESVSGAHHLAHAREAGSAADSLDGMDVRAMTKAAA
ncbi:hypothetical protein ACFW2D_30730 [Streptomyces sp. NPDC058914]|uniref:hypothetical protein n=1 Tax=Streptomyces sp. NPDC058914 TaxID=3346671 RepID=UPI0036AF8047